MCGLIQINAIRPRHQIDQNYYTVVTDQRDNWAKSMAWAAFQETLELVVKDAIEEASSDNAIINVTDLLKSDV